VARWPRRGIGVLLPLPPSGRSGRHRQLAGWPARAAPPIRRTQSGPVGRSSSRRGSTAACGSATRGSACRWRRLRQIRSPSGPGTSRDGPRAAPTSSSRRTSPRHRPCPGSGRRATPWRRYPAVRRR
jgi:hypothetical protein